MHPSVVCLVLCVMVSIGCCLHHERVHPSVGVLSVLWSVCVVGLCVVGGQFLYGGCICAYTMRESIRLWVCSLSVLWSVPLCFALWSKKYHLLNLLLGLFSRLLFLHIFVLFLYLHDLIIC